MTTPTLAELPPYRAAPVRARRALETGLSTTSMGGALTLRVASATEDGVRAERDLRRLAARIEAWAGRLTRFSPSSDLSALNADPDAAATELRPTIAAVLSHASAMMPRTEGAVDVTMLDQRLAVETGDWTAVGRRSSWQLEPVGRRCSLVRDGHARFDLDGVAKGWIADRALRHLRAYPGALVDADGDVAVRPPAGAGWQVAVGHPRDGATELARLSLPPGWPADGFGVATSGTSVHQWRGPAGRTHHLIDPLTGHSALTDVIQATVVAENAAAAECLAKAAVIRGSRAGLGLLERAGAWAALLLLEGGDLVATPGTAAWRA